MSLCTNRTNGTSEVTHRPSTSLHCDWLVVQPECPKWETGVGHFCTQTLEAECRGELESPVESTFSFICKLKLKVMAVTGDQVDSVSSPNEHPSQVLLDLPVK